MIFFLTLSIFFFIGLVATDKDWFTRASLVCLALWLVEVLFFFMVAPILFLSPDELKELNISRKTRYIIQLKEDK